MVIRTLTPELIREGKLLLDALDKVKVSPDAAFWLYSSEGSCWRLVLADRRVGLQGRRETYRLIQKILDGLRSEISQLSLEDVSLRRTDSPIVRSLAKMVPARSAIGGIRFIHSATNGALGEDAVIYRLKRRAA